MTSNKILTIQSETDGLWIRFALKILGVWFVTGVFLFDIFGKFLLNFDNQSIVFWIGFVAVSTTLFGYFTFTAFHENPKEWQNLVHFDLQQRILTIQHLKYSKTDDVLVDFEREKFPFDSIEYINAEPYESKLMSSYYLFRLRSGGRTIPLFALQHPDDYVSIYGRIKGEMGIEVV